MYSPAYRTPAQLAGQNDGRAWIDCNGHHVRHHWTLSQVLPGGTYWSCARCPVRVRLDPGNAGPPAPFTERNGG